MLLDSNIIIYISKDLKFKDRISGTHFHASIISKIEVLGFHKITKQDKLDIGNFMDAIQIHELSTKIVERAIELRQIKNMSLGDSIIASTALVHKLTLVTANVDDFDWIKELKIINPL